MTANKQSTLDDLTAITGIGVARQRWLRETMGVSTYADLAAIDPATVEAKLREEGKIIAPGDIQTWIDQARDLASLQTPANVIPDSSSSVWQPIASFVVEYQRRGDLTAGGSLPDAVTSDGNWPGQDFRWIGRDPNL